MCPAALAQIAGAVVHGADNRPVAVGDTSPVVLRCASTPGLAAVAEVAVANAHGAQSQVRQVLVDAGDHGAGVAIHIVADGVVDLLCAAWRGGGAQWTTLQVHPYTVTCWHSDDAARMWQDGPPSEISNSVMSHGDVGASTQPLAVC